MNSAYVASLHLYICAYIQILRNVISVLTTVHNDALKNLEHLGVIVTPDFSYRKIKLPVKVAMVAILYMTQLL